MLPSEVANISPVPRIVMIGGTVSGAEKEAAVAAAAAAVPELVPELRAASAAAAAPQFPLMLHERVAAVAPGQVCSVGLARVQGSTTERERVAETEWFAASDEV